MNNKKSLPVVIFGIILLHIFLLFYLKFTAWPEMLLWPYLLLHGLFPYKDVAIAHTPLLIVKLAIFYKIFGVGILQLKMFTWLVIALTDILVFVIANVVWRKKVAIFALGIFIILQLFYDGNGLWFDLLLTPVALLTFYFSFKKKYLLTGMLFAVMFLIKQTAVWFLIPIVLQFWLKDKKYVLEFLKGVLLIFCTVFVGLLVSGLIPDFYNWAIRYGIFILPRASGQIQMPDFKNLAVSLFPFSIFIPLLFIKKMRLKNLAIWTVAGIMGAYPRFEYFHFQPGIAFLAFGIGLFFMTVTRRDIFSKILIPIYLLGSFYLLFSFVIRNYGEGTRFYETNVQEVVRYVKNNTEPGDYIFVLNWWENIYPLTNTLPATDPLVPQLSWYQETPRIQEKEVEDLVRIKPKLILLQDYSDSGLSSYKPAKVYDYVMANYRQKEKIDGIKILVPNE